MLLKIHCVSKSHKQLLIFCPIMEDCAFYVEAIIPGIHLMPQNLYKGTGMEHSLKTLRFTDERYYRLNIKERTI